MGITSPFPQKVILDKSDDPPTSFSSSVRFRRPNNATAYGAEDVVGPVDTSITLEFKKIGLPNQRIMITSHSLLIEDTAVIASETSYRLYLYTRPPIVQADNAVFDITGPDWDCFVGFLALGTPVDLGSTLYVETNIVNKQIQMGASSSLWGNMTTAGAYTPTALRAYTPKLHSVLV